MSFIPRRRRQLVVWSVLAVLPFLIVLVRRNQFNSLSNNNVPTSQPMATVAAVESAAVKSAASTVLKTSPTELPLTDEERRAEYDQIRRLVSSPSEGPQKLRTPGRRDHSQHGQARFVDEYLQRRHNGFFIESGASDGETGSNSLFFERRRNWSGLLVEANPHSFRELIGKRRRAWALNACLSPSRRPVVALFKPAGGIGGLSNQMVESHRELVRSQGVGDINATCFPINDIAAALNITHVDYWSLDVEGAEVPILQNVDWTTMPRVDIISVEFKIKGSRGRGDRRASIKKLEQLRRLMEQSGLYRQVGTIKDVDVMFARF